MRFDRDARTAQIEGLRTVRSEEALPSRSQITESLDPGVVSRYVELELIGIHIIDADAVHREHITKTLPDFDLIQDEPMSLIEPVRPKETADASKLDLWHLVERHPVITRSDLQAELLGSVRQLPGIPVTRKGEGLAQLPRGI